MADNGVRKLDIIIGGENAGLLNALRGSVGAVEGTANSIKNHFGGIEAAIGKVTGVVGVMAAALAGGALFGDVIETTKTVIAEITKLKKAFGITHEEASILRVALDDAFISVDQAVNASDKLTKASIKSGDAFRAAGIDIRDSNGALRSAKDVMLDVNVFLLGLKEGKDRDTAANFFYGKSWRELSVVMKLTEEGMIAARDRAKELHLIIGPEGELMAKKYKGAMKDIEDIFESIKVAIGSQLMPRLTELAVVMGDTALTVLPPFITGLNFVIGCVTSLTAACTEAIMPISLLMLGLAAPHISAGIMATTVALRALPAAITAITIPMAALSTAAIGVQTALLGIAAAAAWMAGKGIDKLIYNMFNLDISGLNRPAEEMGKTQANLSKNTEELNKRMKALGFSTWEAFDKAQKAGDVLFDSTTGAWQKAPPKGLSAAQQAAMAGKDAAEAKANAAAAESERKRIAAEAARAAEQQRRLELTLAEKQREVKLAGLRRDQEAEAQQGNLRLVTLQGLHAAMMIDDGSFETQKHAIGRQGLQATITLLQEELAAFKEAHLRKLELAKNGTEREIIKQEFEKTSIEKLSALATAQDKIRQAEVAFEAETRARQMDEGIDKTSSDNRWYDYAWQREVEKDQAVKAFQAQKASQTGYGDFEGQRDGVSAEVDALEISYAMQADTMEQYEARMTEIKALAAEKRAAIDRQENSKRMQLAAGAFGGMASIADSFYKLSGEKSKKAFQTYKLMKSGEIIISTGDAAMKAYSAMAGIPYVGPALGVIAAGAAIAAGMVQLKNVNSATPDGAGAMNAGGGGGPSISSGTIPQQPASPYGKQTGQNIVLNISGNLIGHNRWVEEELAPTLRELVGRGIQFGLQPAGV